MFTSGFRTFHFVSFLNVFSFLFFFFCFFSFLTILFSFFLRFVFFRFFSLLFSLFSFRFFFLSVSFRFSFRFFSVSQFTGTPFLLGSWGMNRSAEQTNHTRTASRFTRFVCPALRFIPHETRKRHSFLKYM